MDGRVHGRMEKYVTERFRNKLYYKIYTNIVFIVRYQAVRHRHCEVPGSVQVLHTFNLRGTIGIHHIIKSTHHCPTCVRHIRLMYYRLVPYLQLTYKPHSVRICKHPTLTDQT